MSGDAKTAEGPVAYRARWVVPIDQPPIAGGIVTIVGGRIVAVGSNDTGQPAHDLGNVAILPGLVNAHTHLEFSLLERPLGRPNMPFAAWIGDVVKQRRESGLGNPEAAVRQGLEESWNAGVAAIGEIATQPLPLELAPEAIKQHLTVFLELLGLAADRIEPLMTLAWHHLDECRSRGILAGLSPHAPYTVHPELLQRACQLSAEQRIPLAMHIAESREELELLSSQTGPLVELLKSLEAWHPGALRLGLLPLDYLRTLAAAHRVLVIHGNYLSGDEIDFLGAKRERLSLVYCPRTHAYFGHDPYPLAKILAAGVRVAVGTDSRASNPDLSLFEELRHIAHHHPDVAPEEILRMGALAGAEALGLAERLGTIAPGKSACLTVIPLATGSHSPYESLFTSAFGSARPLAQFAA